MIQDPRLARSTRRRLLTLAAAAAAATSLAACARRDTSTPAPSSAAPAATAPPAAAAPAATKPAAGAAPAATKPAAGAAPAATKPAAAATPAAAAAAAAKPAGAPAKRGGTITSAVQNDWVSFDNIFNTAEPTTHFMIYDPLFFFKPDEKGAWQPVPGLVEKWEFSGNTGTFNLRKGVKFHDGSDWNADVLKWNFERMINEPKSQARGVLNGVDFKNPITKVDDFTVKVNLTEPSPALVQQLTGAYTFPISKAAFEKDPQGYARNPVGTGPYKFQEWKSGDRVILKRNDNYWMKAADGQALPYLDSLTYRLIIDDSVRLLEMKSRNLDFTELIQGKDIPGVQSDPELRYVEGPWCGNAYRLIFNSKGGPFAENYKLRQAALYAIDREAIAKTLGQGVGAPTRFLLLPGSLGYDESLPNYWYDLDKAKSLMKEAGLANGIDATFTVISRQLDKLQAEVLKEMWDKIGLRVKIDVLERAAWTAALLTGNGNFDVASMRNPSNAGDADPPLRTFLWSKGSFNVAHLENKEMDDALNKASASYDPKVRADAYADVQKIDFKLAYYGYIWIQKWNWVMNKRIQNFPPAMTNAWDFRFVSVA